MKNLSDRLLVLIPFLALSCGGGQSISLVADSPPAAVDRLVAMFKEGVATQNQKLLMDLMDSDYLREQHDEFLDGRTDQFLNEFFAGEETGTGNFVNLQLDELKKIEEIEVKDSGEEGVFEVEAILRTLDGLQVRSRWQIIVQQLSIRAYRAGLRGAVG